MEIITILMAAFIGGLALNVMPCVLPIVSIKIWHLIESSGKKVNEIRKELLLFSLGLISTFVLLGGLVFIFQKLGYFLCWGFHLQSPTFVFILATLMLLVGLNLMGLFESGVKAGGYFGNLQYKLSKKVSPAVNTFLSGVFVTLVATPCSGPLLASAIGYSLLSNPLIAIIIFIAGGLGMALPFIMLAMFPKAVKYMPRPGKWMEYVKVSLGVCAALSSLWLYYLFYVLI